MNATRGTVRRIVSMASLIGVMAALLPAPAALPASQTFYVVEFEQHITDDARAAVVRTGARIVDYEADDAYIVWASPSQADAARDLRAIASVRALPAARKLDASLARSAELLPHAQVTIYAPTSDATLGQLSALGPIGSVGLIRADGLLATAVVSLTRSDIDEVVAEPGVLYVSAGSSAWQLEDEASAQILAGNIDPDANRPVTGYLDWLERKGLSGAGVTVAIVDTGISGTHPDLEGRVVRTYDYGTPDEAPFDTGAHGTHVTGIVGGAPSTMSDGADPDGFVYGVGVAPRAEFVNQNALGFFSPGTGDSENPERLERLSQDAWQAGARMWNSSWHTGEGNRPGYLASTRMMDELSRNARFEKRGREEFLFVFSAGNSGQAGPTAPKEAKNIIAVGSTSSGRGMHWPMTEEIDQVSSFSSRGPTKDGRIFPTVSAPGDTVISAYALEGHSACTSPLDDPLYHCAFSGTSMAAPHATGSSALIHQWWWGRFKTLPSPPMVKALLVNSATDIGDKDIPNVDEGWGRINLTSLFAKDSRRLVDQKVRFGRVGQKRSFTIKVKSTRRPLKITIAWADAPAAIGAEKVLVNDLDLTVELLGTGGRTIQTWRGNVFEKGRSVAGGAPDRLNNVENVYLMKPRTGTYRITVRVANLPGDGVPLNRDETDQDFALVARWSHHVE